MDFTHYFNLVLQRREGELWQLVRNFSKKAGAHWLNRTVNFGIAAALFFAIRWGVSVIVAQISHAQV